MPYEDDYKMWLEEALIRMNPDWVCDEMSENEFTHNWCHQYCGEDDAYITPKCLHMYYHHIARADRKTENSSEKPNNCEECKHWSDTEDGCADRHGCKTTEDCSTVPTSSKMEQVEDEPQTTLCRECDDYAGDGMYCASNYLVRDFSTSAENCKANCIDKAKADIAERSSWSKTYEAMCEPQTDCDWRKSDERTERSK